ncbi:MAG: endonuclease [Bacteroidales bacterium]
MKRIGIGLIFWLITAFTLSAQIDEQERGLRGLRFMFYNVENLFDPFGDSLKVDADFTPDGDKHWTWRKMQLKCSNIARVIIAAGGWEGVELAGLCEVENALVVRQLVKHPLLRPYGYRYLITESPDLRGIDLVLLYRPEKVELVEFRGIRVTNPDNPSWATRDILYAKLVTLYNDTLHLFLNHWPSRRGGEEASAAKRALAAQVLRHQVDSLMAGQTIPFILISGDLNDEPSDSSVRYVLGAVPQKEATPGSLVNLMWPLYLAGYGTHAHPDVTGLHHNLLDQIIVSGNMLLPDAKISAGDPVIGRFPFIMKENASGQDIPYRTYAGPRYLGGFSDHFPVIIDLRLQ